MARSAALARFATRAMIGSAARHNGEKWQQSTA